MKLLLALSLAAAGFLSIARAADELDPALQAKVDAQIKQIQALAADPVIVDAVKAQNASLPAEDAAMTQEKWKSLTIMDPFVRSFTKNPAGQFLKSRKTDAISEAFLSDAAGCKVAFLSKPTSWCHKGKPKHDVPMSGKTWQGPVELDESSGTQQVQVSVPVLDGDKPIGSLVVGLSLGKLKN
ncbi:MAG: hypothetical protein U1F98_12955 [Verrucomicrobiota bacterium]